MITIDRVLAESPCLTTEQLERIYPLTLYQFFFRSKGRRLADRIWIVSKIYPEAMARIATNMNYEIWEFNYLPQYEQEQIIKDGQALRFLRGIYKEVTWNG